MPVNYKKNPLSLAMGHLGGLIAVFFWGISFVSTKVIMSEGHLSPTEAYIYRFFIAYVIVVIISHKRLWCNSLRDELMLMICGVTGGSLYFITENTALEFTLTSNVSLLTSTTPLITIFIVALIYRNQRPSAGALIGSLVAFLGVLCIILNSLNNSATLKINPLGDLLALASALCWSIYSIVLKRVNATYDAMFITRKTFFYGIVTALPFLLVEPNLTNIIVALSNPLVIGNILFLALGASISAYYLWAVTVNKMGAVKASDYLYLQPIVTLIGSALILHEPIKAIGIAGFALILFGLWLGNYLQSHKK